MLRKYLVEYQSINNCGKVTIDNIRRSLSTFFSWFGGRRIESIYHKTKRNDNVLTHDKKKCYDIENVRRYVLWIKI